MVGEAIGAGARFSPRTRLVEWIRTDRGWSLTFRLPGSALQRTRTSWVVDATGRTAAFARAQGARKIGVDHLMAVAACCASPADPPFGHHALIEAVEDGYWYAAPLPGGQQIVAFLSDSDIVRTVGLCEPAAWLKHLLLTHHAARFAPDHAPTLSVRAASSFSLDCAAGDGWIAVGDAASAFDPLSSAGLLKALLTARRGAHAIAHGLSGDRDALRAYAQRSRDDFAQYLVEHSMYYRAERRFATPFWQRRQRRSTMSDTPR